MKAFRNQVTIRVIFTKDKRIKVITLVELSFALLLVRSVQLEDAGRRPAAFISFLFFLIVANGNLESQRYECHEYLCARAHTIYAYMHTDGYVTRYVLA